eukprot:TRINITY_DN2227_c0_g1_i1.p1 TRINITY_DN2227_c0_g1~~TRINITY_DN2227_c0_g1_i1.p1  ORF type:complete len:368 (+),score=120.58 TRINITY_DN2227_c0_g1_i1:77-1180(+)
MRLRKWIKSNKLAAFAAAATLIVGVGVFALCEIDRRAKEHKKLRLRIEQEAQQIRETQGDNSGESAPSSGADLEAKFDESIRYISSKSSQYPLPQQKQLTLYGLFKQAKIGPCDVAAPSLLEFRERAKWDSWNALQDMSKTAAMEAYVALVEGIRAEDDAAPIKPKARSFGAPALSAGHPPDSPFTAALKQSKSGVIPPDDGIDIDLASDVGESTASSGMSGPVFSRLVFEPRTPSKDDPDTFEEVIESKSEGDTLWGYAKRGDIAGFSSEIAKPEYHDGYITDVVDLADEDGRSALHWAVDGGFTEMARFLVEKHAANVNAQDAHGQTPLHYAVLCGFNEIETYLIEKGADVNIKDNEDLTIEDLR